MKKAAELGYTDSQTSLGVMYSKGQGTSEDQTEAIRWYKLAAGKGEFHAIYNLASRYVEGGDGLPQDCVRALEMLKSVEANNPTVNQPYEDLGYIYEKGCGSRILANLDSAKYYYAKGARMGNDYCKKQCDRLKVPY